MAAISAFLAELHTRVASMHEDPAAHAEALLVLAEHEPILGSRFAPARAAIDAAAQALSTVGDDLQRARLLIRIAQLKLVETDFEAADRALARVDELAGTSLALRLLVAVRACRIGIRRSAEHRERARDVLAQTAAGAPADDSDPMWPRAVTELVLAFAELEIHLDAPDDAAFAPVRELVAEYGADPMFADTVFASRQLLVLYAFTLGDRDAAIANLRGVLDIAAAAQAYSDEIQARITLASLLSDDPAPVSQQEAAHHAQRARDRALEHGLHDLHRMALMGQAGVMSRAGKTAGAIDRMLEIARSAAADGDIGRYVGSVGLMAALYTRSGDATSAFRTIAEANHALGAALGKSTSDMFAPLLAELRAQVGAERLEQIAADVNRANALAAELSMRPGKDSA